MNEISIVYSGGDFNKFPARSLGGSPSCYPVEEHLFNNVNDKELSEGLTDYRCVYVVNNSKKVLYNVSLIAVNAKHISFGTNVQSDVQIVKLTDDLPYELNIDGQIVNVPDNTAKGLRKALIEFYPKVKVSGSKNNYKISFNDAKYYPLIESPSEGVVVKKEKDGSPINAIAQVISNKYVTPTNILFDRNNKLMAEVKSGSVFFVWLRRIIPPSSPKEKDGFQLKITAEVKS